jgi:hypothetical protein
MGHVRKRASDEVLMSVSIQNISQKKYNRSDMGGNYRIPAKPGDTIVFSSAGYQPDTTFVAAWMFREDNGYTVYMKPNAVELPTVRVDESTNYTRDSIARKEEYAYLDKFHKEKLAGGKRFSDGVGISFSPLSYFNKKEVDRRRLRKRLRQQEKDYYIDYKFPRGYVARITGLQGDSLQQFMFRYRPSYEFCRKANTEDMLQYINESLKKFQTLAKTPATNSPSSAPPRHGWQPAPSTPYTVSTDSHFPYWTYRRHPSRTHSDKHEIDSIC